MKTTPSASLRLRAATLMLALAACHVPAHANMEICEGSGGCNGTSNGTSNSNSNGNNTNYNSGELERPVMVRAQPATSLQKSVSRFSGGMLHLRQQVIEQNKTSKAQ